MLRFYKYYFEQLATLYAPIGHTTDEPAYFFIQDKYSPDAFDEALGNLTKNTVMLLEPFSWKGSDSNNRNYFKNLQCRFNILKKVTTGEAETINDAMEQCEAIAEELLAKMRTDLEEGATINISLADKSKLVFFKYENIEIDPVGPINLNYYGVSVGFYLKTPAKATVNPANWANPAVL